MDHLELRRLIAPGLPEGLLAHIDRVVAIADRLVSRHALDRRRTLLAAQGHDVLRAIDGASLLTLAGERGLAVDPVERAVPVLLHGPLGAIDLQERFGVSDQAVLDAVRWHSTGHPDYGPEAWAVFVADKVDPQKVEQWPQLAAVAELARESLEAAALAYLDLGLERAAERGWQIHPLALRARNALLDRAGQPLDA